MYRDVLVTTTMNTEMCLNKVTVTKKKLLDEVKTANESIQSISYPWHGVFKQPSAAI